MNPRTATNGASFVIIPNSEHEHTGGVLKIYDLRDADAWMRTSRERGAWGRSRTVIYTLDDDHVAIKFVPGGALEDVS
jgi:hypothetical protein